MFGGGRFVVDDGRALLTIQGGALSVATGASESRILRTGTCQPLTGLSHTPHFTGNSYKTIVPTVAWSQPHTSESRSLRRGTCVRKTVSRTTSASTAPRTPRKKRCHYAYVLITVLIKDLETFHGGVFQEVVPALEKR